MQFLLEVGDVRRFTSFDKLSNFIGLCPDSDSSGTTEKHTGITRRRHNQLRCQLVEASWQLIRRDVAVLEYYQSLTKRMKGQEAIIRIARKLLRRMRAVLLNERMYVKGIDGAVKSEKIDTPQLGESKQIVERSNQKQWLPPVYTGWLDGFCNWGNNDQLFKKNHQTTLCVINIKESSFPKQKR